MSNKSSFTINSGMSVDCAKKPVRLFDMYATLSVLLYPVLQIYTFGSEYANLGFILTVPTFIGYLTRCARKSNRSMGVGNHMLSMWFVFLCICPFSLINADNVSIAKVIGRFGLWLYYIVMLVLSNRFMVREYMIRIFSNLGVIISAILLFEIAYWVFTGVALSLFLFPSMAPERSTTYAQIAGRTMIRPSSLFLEPSSFGCYIAVSLAVTLFELQRTRSNRIKVIIMILAMLVSTSASAIYLMLIEVTWYFYVSKKRKWSLCFTALVATLGYIYIPAANGIIGYGLGRIQISSSRLFSFIPYMKNASVYTILFGCGVGNQTAVYGNYIASQVSSFLSGVGRVLVESGIAGVISFGFITIGDCFRIKGTPKIYVLLFLVMNLFETALFSWFLVLTLVWINNSCMQAQGEKQQAKC